GVERAGEPSNASEGGAHGFRDRDLARADPALQLGSRHIRERGHGFCHSPVKATARQTAASPPLNFHGKQPRISRLFCSSGASISPPRFSICTQSFGNSALCVSW